MNQKPILWIAVGVLLTIVLGAGAYTAVQLLAQPDEETAVSPASGARVMESVQVDGSGAPVSVRTTILPAPELPETQSISSGIVLARQDDTLTVGTGGIELSVEVDVDGATGKETVSVVPSTTGPEVEVVLTQNTIVYRDVTDMASQLPDGSGEVTITQAVRPVDNSDEIKEKMEIQIWGERRGDRIIADVVVFGPLAGGQFE